MQPYGRQCRQTFKKMLYPWHQSIRLIPTTTQQKHSLIVIQLRQRIYLHGQLFKSSHQSLIQIMSRWRRRRRKYSAFPEEICEQRIGRDYQSRFWCGFCGEIVVLQKKGLEGANEKFDQGFWDRVLDLFTSSVQTTSDHDERAGRLREF
ncbi:hypothetical protein EPUS_08646 [Endocarpon pusillum Z07020]|uniref:Uncharacterized protein n=1 Tax=Endocarpon pusillum (strain Z07020 / HMAS-L-300199) TaxID=1263415 RepID=U1HKA0_ENDPU|nr:uncharacterized protein EPUS_08646 [Endocarpon pusillum Z07020]ERF69374.1 hypothetical protein EPUS_08646 [Endocarpon pusillum Z07020]